MRLAGQKCVAHAQRMVLVIVVVGRFGPPILLRTSRFCLVQLNVEWILVDVLRCSVKQSGAVISRI